MAKKRNKPKPSAAPSTNPPVEAPSDPAATKPIAVEPPAESARRRTPTKVSRYVSFGLLLAVIILVAFLFFEVMISFLVPLFLASILVVVFRPLHQWFLEQCGGRQQLAAGLTTTAILLLVLIPLSALLVLAAVEGRQVLSKFSASGIIDDAQAIRERLNLNMPSAEAIRSVQSNLENLRVAAVIDDAEYDRHQNWLYQAEESAKAIARSNDLPFAELDPGTSDSNEEVEPSGTSDPWESFVLDLRRARQFHYRKASELSRGEMLPNQNGVNSGESSDQVDERLKQTQIYRQLIAEAEGHFSDFKTQLLGGRMRATVVEFVNPSPQELEAYAFSSVRFLRDRLLKLGGNAFGVVGSVALGFLIMVIGLYFFLLDGPRMIESFKGLSPLDDDHEQELVTEFARVSRAVVVATLLSALVQGFLAGIGFYFAGLESIFLLTVLSAVLAMVPFVGAASVWVPCCLYLFLIDSNPWAAGGLALYGFFVISMADNVIKPYVLHGQSNLHPLLALLSVLGGVATLGPIGILVGPMVVAFLQTLLKILQQEILELDEAETTAPAET